MPEGKRPDSRRRTPASRPGKGGDAGRGRPRAAAQRREPRPSEATAEEPKALPAVIAESVTEAIEQQSQQRLGSTARRAAILAAVVCVLTLTIAGPVRTFFAQRAEMKQLEETEAVLRSQIADLEQQKVKLADPVYIAAQARERLGFVMPGDIPYQVQLPPGAVVVDQPGSEAPTATSTDPWYTSLWHTIADAPHNVPPVVPPPAAPPPPPPPPGG